MHNASCRPSEDKTPEGLHYCNEGTKVVTVRNVIKIPLFYAQFLLTSLTYVLLSYFVCLHCANIHIPLRFFLSLMTSRTSRQDIHIYSVLENTYRTTRL